MDRELIRGNKKGVTPTGIVGFFFGLMLSTCPRALNFAPCHPCNYTTIFSPCLMLYICPRDLNSAAYHLWWYTRNHIQPYIG